MATDPILNRTSPRRLAFSVAGIVMLASLMIWRADEYRTQTSADALLTLAGPTMGTTFTVKIVQPPTARVPDAEITSLVQEALDRVDVLMSTYRDDSEVSRFNADTSLNPMALSHETAEVVACALKVNEESGGAYDVTVGPLVNAYGFGPKGRQTPPTAETLEQLRRHVGHDKLRFDPVARSLQKTDPAVLVDLNSIAPGFAVDLIARELERRGVMHYMIEIGGEVRAQGHNGNGVPWRIGVEKPVENERNVQQVLPLDGLALATSGDYREYYEEDGLRISHTIDARTGRPVSHNLASVSVVHPECMWADAYATAIMALGPIDGSRLAEDLELPALFVIREIDGSFTERATPAFIGQFGHMDSGELPKS